MARTRSVICFVSMLLGSLANEVYGVGFLDNIKNSPDTAILAGGGAVATVGVGIGAAPYVHGKLFGKKPDSPASAVVAAPVAQPTKPGTQPIADKTKPVKPALKAADPTVKPEKEEPNMLVAPAKKHKKGPKLLAGEPKPEELTETEEKPRQLYMKNDKGEMVPIEEEPAQEKDQAVKAPAKKARKDGSKPKLLADKAATDGAAPQAGPASFLQFMTNATAAAKTGSGATATADGPTPTGYPTRGSYGEKLLFVQEGMKRDLNTLLWQRESLNGTKKQVAENPDKNPLVEKKRRYEETAGKGRTDFAAWVIEDLNVDIKKLSALIDEKEELVESLGKLIKDAAKI